MSILSLVGVTLVIKVFKDDKFKGSGCLVRSSLIFTKKSLKCPAFIMIRDWANVFDLVLS